MRRDVHFDSQGVKCKAWFYEPSVKQLDGSPCVILAHGFDGVKPQRLAAYAQKFADAGLAVLVFDYRYFGATAGLPRQLFSNAAQLEDWHAAIDYVYEQRDDVNRRRIALWGTSTSGGHVVQVAADDPRVAAVVAQMPFASGFAQLRSMTFLKGLWLLLAGLRDQVGAWLDRKPHYIQAAGKFNTAAVNTAPEALSGLDRITPGDSTWLDYVTARFTLTTTFYNPGRAAKRLRCPLLVCIADGDDVMPVKPALKMARHGMLRRYGFSHFQMYDGPGFDTVSKAQAEFLYATLVKDAA